MPSHQHSTQNQQPHHRQQQYARRHHRRERKVPQVIEISKDMATSKIQVWITSNGWSSINMERSTNKSRQNRNDRRQQPTPPQKQQQQQQPLYQKRIVVPIRGVSVTFCVTSTSPMVVQVVSPVPVKNTPIPGGVRGRLQLADSVGGGVSGGSTVELIDEFDGL
ncbi:unnamed protein product [Rotaria sp. Silwood1]|nr:unnamed protein product [Rotaria sp. Silwood1]CAF1624361.1 unnamed protein product [Rotaria sp. Silwood1]CAF1624430.1 unnamed protein product [Rotaria sp. Silwood1]CAF4786195.1 unnamed protein product [Rotaria sp. Silwood1]